MNRITYFSSAILIAFFLPWFVSPFFTISGFDLPNSTDKILNVINYFNTKKDNYSINISYILYLIPILSIINIIGDFNKKNRPLLVNEFTISLLSIVYIYNLLEKMNIKIDNVIGIGYIASFIISIIGLILVVKKRFSDNINNIKNLIQNPSTDINPSENIKNDLFNQLEKLHKLNSEGVITKEIYEFEKNTLLEKIERINLNIEIEKEEIVTEIKVENKSENEEENSESFFLKYRLFILIGIIILIIFSAFYYYENIKEPNKELDFNEIENSSNKTEIKNLQELANRHFDKYKSRLETENTITNDLDTTYVADFTNDGLLDVVLDYGLDPKEGNWNAGGGILLYKNNGNGITFIKQYSPEYIYNFDKILNSKIYLTKLEYSENDGRCCPSINKKMELKLDGENIIEKEIK